MKKIQNDVLKSIVIVFSIVLFVVGIIVITVNIKDTYAYDLCEFESKGACENKYGFGNCTEITTDCWEEDVNSSAPDDNNWCDFRTVDECESAYGEGNCFENPSSTCWERHCEYYSEEDCYDSGSYSYCVEVEDNCWIGDPFYDPGEGEEPYCPFYSSETECLDGGFSFCEEVSTDCWEGHYATESDVNTLEGITLSSGSLNSVFDKNVNEYAATVNSDKVTIGATKTDENSTISGDVGEVTLHYGTNTFYIFVTSAIGTENTYTLNIYRPYEFSSTAYKYSKDNNYIYTGTNVDSDSILSNVDLSSELTASIKNNKLVISYVEEKLLEIDIFNISSSKYRLFKNVMYIESNLTYENFMNSINLNGVTAKVFDTNGNEVTSGIILEEYKFKIYYVNDLLDEYTINEEYFSIENLDVDQDNKIIKNVKVNTTYKNIKSNINTIGSVRIIDKDGNELSETDIVKTYDTIVITLNGSTYTYTMSVRGDVNGDGIINVNDIVQLSKNIIKNIVINNFAYKYASDINSDNKVDINDVIRLAKYVINGSGL